MGKKWGAVLGGVAGILSRLININELQTASKNNSKIARTVGFVAYVSAYALGGHWLGKITDKYTNKQIAKEADKSI